MANTRVEMSNEMMEQVNGGWDWDDVWDWVKDTTSDVVDNVKKGKELVEKTLRFL